MNRGDVWMIDLGGKIGMRPAVVVTRHNVLPYLNKVSVVEVTSRGKGYPTEIFIGQKANLPKPSFVQADNIHTIPKQKLVRCIGILDDETMSEISRKIVFALGLEG